MKTVTSRLFKKYLEKRKLFWHSFVGLLVGYISVKDFFENYNSVGVGAQNIEKVVRFWPNFDPNFTNNWRA